MNLVLYGATFFQWLMTWASVMAVCIPALLLLAYLITRKQDYCRALVMWLSAKTCFWYFNDEAYKMAKSDQ